MGDTSVVVTGSHDRTLKIWDLRSRACKLIIIFKFHWACTRAKQLLLINWSESNSFFFGGIFKKNKLGFRTALFFFIISYYLKRVRYRISSLETIPTAIPIAVDQSSSAGSGHSTSSRWSLVHYTWVFLDATESFLLTLHLFLQIKKIRYRTIWAGRTASIESYRPVSFATTRPWFCECNIKGVHSSKCRFYDRISPSAAIFSWLGVSF